MPLDPDVIAKAMKEAAWKARYGTREEQSGKFLGKQEAVEQAAARVRAKLAAKG